MLKCFFYYHFVLEEEGKETQSDPTTAYVEAINGKKDIKNRQVLRAWNLGVEIFDETIAYMEKIESDTPDTYGEWIYETLNEDNEFGII